MANRIVWLASQAGRLDELAQLPPALFDDITLIQAVYVAASNDHAGIVRFLLRAGKNNNTHLPWNTFLNMSLNFAVWYDSADTLRALVLAKADLAANGPRCCRDLPP